LQGAHHDRPRGRFRDEAKRTQIEIQRSAILPEIKQIDIETSQAKVDQEQRKLATMRAALDTDTQTAAAELAIAEAEVEQLRSNRENSLIRSPINGVILQLYARQGDAHPATRMFERLSPEEPERNFAVTLDSTTDEVREPLYDVDQEGFRLEFWPSRFALRRAVDAMLILNRTTPISLLQSSRRPGDSEL